MTKETKDLYNENYNTFMGEIKEDTNRQLMFVDRMIPKDSMKSPIKIPTMVFA
jgi:hypothetical protein